MHLDRKNQGLVVVSDNGEYDLLDLDKRRWTETHRILWDHRNAVDRSALSPDGRFLAVSTMNRMVHVIERESDQVIASFETSKKQPALAWTNDSKHIVTSSSQIHFWEAATGQHKEALGKGTTVDRKGLDVSPDGRWLASSNGRQIELWDMRDRTLSRTLGGTPLQHRVLASRLIPLVGEYLPRSLRPRLERHGWYVRICLERPSRCDHQVVWLPDQSTLASSDDEEVLLWGRPQ